MSHLGARKLDCPEARARSWELLDGELSTDIAAALQDHLAICYSCDADTRRRRALLDALRRTQRITPAPPALRVRVTGALLLIRASTTTRS